MREVCNVEVDMPEIREEIFMITDVWFEIEYSVLGDNDWFSSADTFDSEKSAVTNLSKLAFKLSGFEFRIVKKTLTTEATEKRYSSVRIG